MRAAQLVKVDWDVPASSKLSSEDFLTESKKLRADQTKGLAFVSDGSVDTAEKEAKEILEASYTTEMVGHVSLEPQSALVQNVDGIWNVS